MPQILHVITEAPEATQCYRFERYFSESLLLALWLQNVISMQIVLEGILLL